MNQDGDRVVIAVFKPGGMKRVVRYCRAALEAGWEVRVLLADGHCWAKRWKLPPGVEVVSLREAERAVPVPWLYTAAVERVPGGLLHRAARLPGPLGRPFGFAARAHRRVAGALRRRVFWRVYGWWRPRTLRRLAMRRTDRLGLASARRLIVADDAAVPFGWRAAGRFPELEVTTAFDAEALTASPTLEPAA